MTIYQFEKHEPIKSCRSCPCGYEIENSQLINGYICGITGNCYRDPWARPVDCPLSEIMNVRGIDMSQTKRGDE